MIGPLAFFLAGCKPTATPEVSSEVLPPPDTAATDSGATTRDTDTAAPADLTGLTINEFMAYDVPDGFAGGSDWIEIHNGATVDLDLSSVSLWSHDDDDQYPWLFPAGTTIAAGAFLVVICDGTNQAGEVPHASFRIERHDGTLRLADDLDIVHYDYQTTGHSSARTTDGGAEWAVGVSPTPGVSNAD